MLEELLPAAVAVAEAFGDVPEAALFPEEAAAIAGAVERRRREFASARSCAHTALRRLGLPAAPIVPGPRREPLWPDGVTGSLTHCDGYRAAAVARAADVLALGIDAEPHAELPAGVLAAVAGPDERAALAALAADSPGHSWDRLLFCAKEAVYKTWYPLTGRWLGFADAAVTISEADGTFTARLLVPGPDLGSGPLTGFSGRWLIRDSLILAAIAIPAPDVADRRPG